MRFSKFLAVILTLVSMSLFFSTAWAKKSTESASTEEELTLVDVGLPSFDAIYAKAKTLIESINSARDSVKDANTKLVTVLGLAEGTPLKDALEDLKKKAEGKITVAMNGKTPTLKASDAVPQNVTDGINAVNALATACTKGIDTLTAAMGDAKALGAETIALPPKVPAEIKSAGLKATEVPGVTKKVNSNNKVVAKLPTSMDNLVKSLQDTLNTITSVFTG